MGDYKTDPNAPPYQYAAGPAGQQQQQQYSPYPPAGYSQPPPGSYQQQRPSDATLPPQYVMASASAVNMPVYGAQPGYPGYAQQVAVQPGTIVVTQSPVISLRFGTAPVQIVCPYCKTQVITSTHYENGGMVWLVCMFMCLFFFCLFFIAFLIDDFKDVVHNCPSCGNCVGRFSRM